MSKLKNLKAQRADLITQAKALQNSENITNEVRNQVDDLFKKIENIDRDIHAEVKLISLEQQQQGVETDKELDKVMDSLNFMEAIRNLRNNQPLTGAAAELNEEAKNEARRLGITLSGNFNLPSNYAHKKYKNSLSATGGTDGDKGGVTVQTNVMSLIDYQRANLPMVQLGATFFTDITGNLKFPRIAAEGAEVAVTTETGEATDIEPDFDSFTLQPNRVPAFLEVTDQLLNQSSADIANWINRELGYKIAKAIHKRCITTLLAASGLNSVDLGVNGGALDWAKIVEFETKIGEADGMGDLGWLTNPTVVGKLKTTQKVSGQAIFLMEDGKVNGYDVVRSTLVPKNLAKADGTNLSAAILGYWPDFFIAQWGGVSLLVNPFSKDTTGITRINAWTYTDEDVAKPGNFSIAKDIITTP